MQTDGKSSTTDASSSDSLAHKPMVPRQIYKEKIDMSRIPYFYVGPDSDSDDDEETGFYEFPENDKELLRCCGRPAPRYCNGRLKRSRVYFVEVEADSCTAEDCLQLLKAIDCKNQFMSCSVERAGWFLAELHMDEADKLEGLNGIRRVFPYADMFYDID